MSFPGVAPRNSLIFGSGTNFLGLSGTRILYGSSLPVYRVTPESWYLDSVWMTGGVCQFVLVGTIHGL